MEPWMWIAGGFALAAVEVLVPGFIFLGFAVGAIALGLIMVVVPPVALPMALLVWAILSLIAWVLLRAAFTLPGGAGKPKIWDRDINEQP